MKGGRRTDGRGAAGDGVGRRPSMKAREGGGPRTPESLFVLMKEVLLLNSPSVWQLEPGPKVNSLSEGPPEMLQVRRTQLMS